MSILPGDRVVSTSNDRTLKLWDLSGNLLKNMDIGCILEDGRVVTFMGKVLKIWDFNEDCSIELIDHTNNINYVVSTHTRIVSGSNDSLKIWDSKDGMLLHTFNRHINNVSSLPDGRIVSGSLNDCIKIWENEEC